MADPLRRHGLPEALRDLPSSVPEALALRAEAPADPFVIGTDFRLTFGEAEMKSAKLAGRLLAGGIGKGTRAALLFPNGPEWAVTWLAMARIGALSVPLSTFAPGGELARMIRHVDVHALLMASTLGGANFNGVALAFSASSLGFPALINSSTSFLYSSLNFT